MEPSALSASLEEQIDQWRTYLRRRQAIHTVDVAELEDHLREQVDHLLESGLAADEAFLVAVKRLGNLDALSREFAREHSDRLWKQLVAATPDGAHDVRARTEGFVAFGLAILAAVLLKLPELFGVSPETHEALYVRNAALLVLPLLTGFFAWKRQIEPRTMGLLGGAFAIAALVINAMPFTPEGSTFVLATLHLPIALWLLVGLAYTGRRWSEVAGRMDFIRFSGELFIYYVLIALGGGVLTGMSLMIFEAIGLKIEELWAAWVLLPGAAGAVLVAAWLVEAKQSVIENMAPVLTRLFTPLFAMALLLFLGALAWTGRGIGMDRNILIGFDALLALVVALLLYSISARDPQAPVGPFDIAQLVLVVAALVTDVIALRAIAGRIDDFGFTPNRVAALGENLLLLVNLGVSAVLSAQFVLGRGSLARLEKWQTDFLPLYALWAAVVVVVFPFLFHFA